MNKKKPIPNAAVQSGRGHLRLLFPPLPLQTPPCRHHRTGPGRCSCRHPLVRLHCALPLRLSRQFARLTAPGHSLLSSSCRLQALPPSPRPFAELNLAIFSHGALPSCPVPAGTQCCCPARPASGHARISSPKPLPVGLASLVRLQPCGSGLIRRRQGSAGNAPAMCVLQTEVCRVDGARSASGEPLPRQEARQPLVDHSSAAPSCRPPAMSRRTWPHGTVPVMPLGRLPSSYRRTWPWPGCLLFRQAKRPRHRRHQSTPPRRDPAAG